eukprot:7771986-Pyramimonas_sp.AAC.1
MPGAIGSATRPPTVPSATTWSRKLRFCDDTSALQYCWITPRLSAWYGHRSCFVKASRWAAHLGCCSC